LPASNPDTRRSSVSAGRRSALQAAVQAEIELTPADVLALVSEPLQEVEKEFQRNLESEVPIVAEVGRYIAESGGKRIRPGLLLLASRACGYQGQRDILYGAVYEFIHTATLVHDDVIDEADTRRGRNSVNSRWGNTLTILMGDYLYIRSLSMALTGENLGILNLISEITLRMIEGELMQTHTTGRLDVTQEQYMDIVTRKTARLFAGCSETAAVLAEREEWRGPLATYGHSIGVAYQLVDDMLDFTSEREVLGKPVASDLKEGKLTLPVIDLLSRRDEMREVVARIIEHPDDCAAAYERLVDGLHSEGSLRRAHGLALEHAARARQAASVLPPSVYRDALMSLPDLLVTRQT